MVNYQFAEVLRQARLKHSETRATVANKVGVTKTQLEDFENGDDVPDQRVWARYKNLVDRGLRSYQVMWKEASTSVTTPVAEEIPVKKKPVEKIEIVEAAPIISKKFGALLKAARIKDNTSVTDLAETMGVTASAVSKWESGVVLPRLANMEKLNELYPELRGWEDKCRDMDIPGPRPGFKQTPTVSLFSVIDGALSDKDPVDILQKIPTSPLSAQLDKHEQLVLIKIRAIKAAREAAELFKMADKDLADAEAAVEASEELLLKLV